MENKQQLQSLDMKVGMTWIKWSYSTLTVEFLNSFVWYKSPPAWRQVEMASNLKKF